MKYTKGSFFTGEISALPPDGAKTFYLCIGRVCKGNGCPNSDCYHTKKIEQAKNKSFPNANSIFRRAIDGSWWEDEE